MNRRQFLAGSTVGLAAAIAGCVGDVRSDTDGEAPTESASGERERADRGEITVTASGDVEAEPDRAVVTVGVQASGESADAVTDELATGPMNFAERSPLSESRRRTSRKPNTGSIRNASGMPRGSRGHTRSR